MNRHPLQLIYGTTNKGKIDSMRKRLEPLEIEMLSLADVNARLDIDESGNSPLENAKIKALAYYRALKQPVFSADSGLYLDGVDDARQPGVHVRRVGGRNLTDDEMIEYYSSLAAEMGGSIMARYKNGICLVMDEEHIYEYMGDDIASEPFLLVSTPHKIRTEGFPLDSLSVDIASGEYYYNLSERQEKYTEDKDGFTEFFRRAFA